MDIMNEEKGITWEVFQVLIAVRLGIFTIKICNLIGALWRSVFKAVPSNHQVLNAPNW